MGAQYILEELALTPKYLPSYGMPATGVDAVLVGDALDFTTVAALIGAPSVVTLTRRPAGSAATVASSAFTCDLPGLYTVTVLVAGVTRTFSVYAFPVSFVTSRANPDGSGIASPAKFLTRNHLKNFVLAGVSAASLATLETASPAPTMGMLGAIHSSSPLQGG